MTKVVEQKIKMELVSTVHLYNCLPAVFLDGRLLVPPSDDAPIIKDF